MTNFITRNFGSIPAYSAEDAQKQMSIIAKRLAGTPCFVCNKVPQKYRALCINPEKGSSLDKVAGSPVNPEEGRVLMVCICSGCYNLPDLMLKVDEVLVKRMSLIVN